MPARDAATSLGEANRSSGSLQASLVSRLSHAKKLDLKGLALVDELRAAIIRRETLGGDSEQLHRHAVNDIEPVLELLQDHKEEVDALATAAHSDVVYPDAAPGKQTVNTETEGYQTETILLCLKIADFIEQDAQLKAEMISNMTQASTSEELMALRILWETRPWLEHDELTRTLAAADCLAAERVVAR